MKLARKLTLALFIGVLAVLTAHAYVRVLREVGLFEGDARRDAHIMGRVLAAAVTEVWRSDGRESALRLVDNANERESHVLIRYIALDPPGGDETDPPAVPRDELAPVARGLPVVRNVRRGDGEDYLVTYAPVRLGERYAGAIELAESLAGEEEYIERTIVNSAIATGGVTLVCGLVASVIGVWFVGRPMQSLIEQARRVGAGDLSARPSLRQRDEIGELSAEMNAMCDRLATAQEAIAAATAERIGALEQLRHADRLATVGKLASGLAHELGAPLQVISGRARMISDEDVPAVEAPDNARIILEQAQRMAQIIRQLLDFARRRGAEKAPIDLADLVAQSATMLAPLAESRGVEIRVAAGTAPLTADVDPEQIRQALTNLILNGIQSMRAGGRLTVGVEVKRARPPADIGGDETEHACLWVEDEGEGMSEETTSHIFEPFFTTKEVGEGTGLGLAVTYGIVREHGGWIDVRSRPSEGSRFAVYLPRGVGS